MKIVLLYGSFLKVRVTACRKAAEVAEEEEGEVAELSSMFTVGQPLIVAVVSCLQV